MLPLEVSLPLDPLLFSSSWAWLFALCVATVATFSRLSLSSFFLNPSLSSLVSPRHVKLHQSLAAEGNPSSGEDPNASNVMEALCDDQAGSEKGNTWSFPLQECAAGEENAVGETEERDVSEASKTPQEACTNHVEASPPAVEAPRAYTSCVQATSWSQSLHRQISARVGSSFLWAEACAGMPLHYQARLPCVAENLHTQNASNLWSWQQLQTLQLLQVPSRVQSMISAVEVGDGLAHLGYYSGEIALWDVEKRVCLSRLCNREGPVAALFVAPSYPRVVITAGVHALNRNTSIVTVWDDRCASHSMNSVLLAPVNPMKARQCGAYKLGIAGGGCLLSYDLRMPKGNPIFLYTDESSGKSTRRGLDKKHRVLSYDEEEDNIAFEAEEDADKSMVIDKMYSSHLEVHHASSKRRCSFIMHCLSFMCCLVQNPSAL